MNPRITDIANRVSELESAGLSEDRAIQRIAALLDVSTSHVLDCVLIATSPDPSDEILFCPSEHDWHTLNTDPRFGNEFGFVSIGTLVFVIAAFLALAYVLT